MAMGPPLSPVMANIYIEYFEELALETTPETQEFGCDTEMRAFLLYRTMKLQVLLDHINLIRPQSKNKTIRIPCRLDTQLGKAGGQNGRSVAITTTNVRIIVQI